MKLQLDWRRPLFYCLLPVWLVLVFVGFPLPLPPPRPTKAGQEQSAPAERPSARRADVR